MAAFIPPNASSDAQQQPRSRDFAPGVCVSLEQLIALRHQQALLPSLDRISLTALQHGSNPSAARGRGLLFEELRHYHPGDDIRHLDWKVTRRTGQPHIRVFSEERERLQFVLVDQRPSMFFGSQRQMKSVLAAELFALLAWQTLARGDRLGALLCGVGDGADVSAEAEHSHSESIRLFKPARSDSGLFAVLRCLAAFNQRLATVSEAEPADSLNQALLKLSHLCGQGADIWLISDLPGLAQLSPERLQRLQRHNQLRLVEISDPLEAILPAAGRWAFAGAGQLLQLDTGQKALRQRYAEQYQQQSEALTERLSRARIGLLQLSTANTLQQQIAGLGAPRGGAGHGR